MRGFDPRIHLDKMKLAKRDGSPEPVYAEASTGHPLQGSPKLWRRGQVRHRRRHFCRSSHGRRHFFFFWYIPSMRCVTRKPPKILTDAKISATKPKPRAQAPPLPTIATPTASSAPTTITEEIALVTDISGVCSAGVTDHTTK